MTVRELRTRVDHGEYVYWTRYYALEAQQIELERKMAGA